MCRATEHLRRISGGGRGLLKPLGPKKKLRLYSGGKGWESENTTCFKWNLRSPYDEAGLVPEEGREGRV